jgi:transposase
MRLFHRYHHASTAVYETDPRWNEQILECDKAGITVTLPKPMTSNAKAEGRFGKQDFPM